MDFSDDLLKTLHHAKHIVVFTGAGISAESGIATFRDAGTGLWEQYDPCVLASPQGYLRTKHRFSVNVKVTQKPDHLSP